MAYTPTTWNRGDTVTSTKLNKLEQGVANAGSAVIITDNGTSLDKTFAEIYDLILNGIPCYIKYSAGASSTNLDTEYSYATMLLSVVKVQKYNNDYRIYAVCAMASSPSGSVMLGTSEVWAYQASSSSGYPTFYRTTHTLSTSIETFDYRFF